MEPSVPQPANTTDDDASKSSTFNATKFKELLKTLKERQDSRKPF